MKKLITLVCLGFVFAVPAAAIAGEQQNKMKGCNAEAKGMKGTERKEFMSKCLKKDYVLKSDAAPVAASAARAEDGPGTTKPGAEDGPGTSKPARADKKVMAQPAATAAAPAAMQARQQDKMKNCNAEANTRKLKGVERKTFMSSCLKG